MDEKEELRGRIYSCLDRMGRYHLFLLGALGTFSVVAGYSNTVGVFYTYTPDFYCGKQDPPEEVKWNECSTNVPSVNCTFNPDEHFDSIVTEYQLICENRYLAALSSTIYFAGVMIGALIFGPLADSIGRRRTLQITTTGHIVTGLLLHFTALTPSISAFSFIRFVQGCFNQGMQNIGYTSLVELTPAKYRTMMGCVWEFFWSIGLIYVGCLSMINYEWRTLQLYLIIPTTLGVLFTFILPESLHWLWTQNKFRAAIETYSKIARRNGDILFAVEERQFQRDKNWETLEAQCRQLDKDSDQKMGTFSLVSVIFRHVVLRKHILIMSLMWFSVTICYYAITFFLPNLAGDRHTNFIMGACVEMISFILTYFVMQKFGRSNIIGIFMMSNAALCIAYALTELIEDLDAATRDTTGIVILLLAKGLSFSGICGMYIFTGELFPTICRGTVFGICGFCSRIGSLIAPFIVSVTELVNPSLPMFLLGGLLIFSGSLMFLLPETLKIQIPNTMQDVEDLWGKRKKMQSRISL